MGHPIPVRELAHHPGRYVELVEQGQRVPITRNGRLVAVLVPPSDQDTVQEWLAEHGLFDPKHPGEIGWIDKLPTVPTNKRSKGSLTETLVALRHEENR